MHWIFIASVVAFLAGGMYGRSGAEDDHTAIFKRLSSECRAELQAAAREPPHGETDR